MKAKKVCEESLTNILVPKTENEILASLAKYKIGEYVKKKEGYSSKLRGKRLKSDPLVVKIYYDALEKGLPVKNLEGKTGKGFDDDARFTIDITDLEGRKHHLIFYQKDKWFVSGKGNVPMTWLNCMDYSGGGMGPCNGPNQVKSFEDFLEIIENTQEIGRETIEWRKKWEEAQKHREK